MNAPRLSRILPAALGLFAALGCSRGRSGGGRVDQGAAAAEQSLGDEPQPVYPNDGAAPDPRAERLCHALHVFVEERRAACCGAPTPAETLVGECVRMLSAALRARAVELDPAAIDACAAGMKQAFEGCGWVGPRGPRPPEVCRGLLRGTVADGRRCRSSLECAGGLRCQGLGALTSGVCRPPRPTGLPCATGIDPLAVHARQDDIDLTHPECEGHCARHRCAPTLVQGAICTYSAQCGRGLRCSGGRCVVGALALRGEACSGDCEEGARCWGGRCMTLGSDGAPCETDFDCRGTCVKGPGEARGGCKRDCLHR